MKDLIGKIYAAKMVFAKAAAKKVVCEHDRTIVMSSAKNVIGDKLQLADGKAPSEQKLERLARDTQEYINAVKNLGIAVCAAIEAEAEMEKLEREYKLAELQAV